MTDKEAQDKKINRIGVVEQARMNDERATWLDNGPPSKPPTPEEKVVYDALELFRETHGMYIEDYWFTTGVDDELVIEIDAWEFSADQLRKMADELEKLEALWIEMLSLAKEKADGS
jgi:hypothetical protein